MEKKRLGDILIDCNLISKEQLSQALSFQKEKGIKLGQALIDQGLVTEDDIIWALGNQLNISFIHLNPGVVDPEAIKMITPEYSHEKKVIPLYVSGNQFNICMVDPLDSDVVDYLASKTRMSISLSICTRFDFEQTFAAIYGPMEVQEKQVENIIPDKLPAAAEGGGVPKGLESPEKVINYVLGQAIINKVDRIHFEPSDKGVLIRFRTFVTLARKLEIPLKMHQEIISKLKTLAQISQGQGPSQTFQVGHFRVTVSGRRVNVQAMFYPTINGEMVILKLSYFGENTHEILGRSKVVLDDVAKFMHSRPGVLYVTGPRESGRSMSAYFLLSTYDLDTFKAVTVEEPVQTNVPRVTQLQVGQNGLKSHHEALQIALQLDPDIVYLDQWKGKELATEIAFAGLGGRTIVTSFMAHDAASSILSILDQIPDPLVAANSLCGVLCQRLVRTLCPACKKSFEPSAEHLDRLKLEEKRGTFFQAGGCDTCMNTGYSGKTLVSEFVPGSANLRQMMINKQTYQEFYHFIRKQNVLTHEERVGRLVQAGETSFDEFQRLF